MKRNPPHLQNHQKKIMSDTPTETTEESKPTKTYQVHNMYQINT